MAISITQISADQTWDLRHKVMWPDKNPDYVRLPLDDMGKHYGLWKNEELISVISLFITKDEAQFRKFATKTVEQGKGYGSQLLNHLMNEIPKYNVKRIWCNARMDKKHFYQRFGMKETEHRFNRGKIEYVIMEKHL